MLVVEPTGQRDCMATSGQNISKAEKKTLSIRQKQSEILPRLLLNLNRKSYAAYSLPSGKNQCGHRQGHLWAISLVLLRSSARPCTAHQ